MSRPSHTQDSTSTLTIHPDPLELFQLWFDQARTESRMEYPNAVTLSTVNDEGYPDGRIVLLKGLEDGSFVFFTNHKSSKGKALSRDSRVGMTFYWDALGRQVRVRGHAQTLPETDSDDYFASRPRVSQIGAWASAQSEELSSREELEARVREVAQRFDGAPIPRPPHWGGFQVRPVELEFWLAREGRLHDRVLYRREARGPWTASRLNP